MQNPALRTSILILLSSAPAWAQLGPPPVPPQNPITPEKVLLGKALFWEEQLSSDNTIACGTCHIPSQGGSDPRLGPGSVHPGADGIVPSPDDELNSPGVRMTQAGGNLVQHMLFGLEPQVTDRHASSTVAAAYFPELFWDGRADGTFIDPETGNVSIPNGGALENQALGPILSEVEMGDVGRTWDDVREKLEQVRPLALAFDLTPDLVGIGDSSYPDLFEAAFGDEAITAERIAYALASYQRTLIPDDTPWDRFMAGQQNAMTPNQVQGWNVFTNPGSRCDDCHQPPLFSDGTYRNLGLRPLQQDQGRREVTGLFGDRGRFKTPSLRGAAERGAFFHTGEPAIDSMTEVVNFYRGGGGPNNANKDPLMNNINIPPQAVNNLVAFLNGALTDPRMAAELPPFDRPRLGSERAQPLPIVMGNGQPGTGGLIPEVLPVSPMHLGSRGFKLAVHNALGGATGFVILRLQAVSNGGVAAAPFARAIPMVLTGQGPGDGLGTLNINLPQDPVFSGASLVAQWRLRDAGAPGGWSSSARAVGTLF